MANTEQAAYWNGAEGAHWVTEQRRYEEMLEPLIAVLLDAAQLQPGDAVLDVGCGCGATTIAAARVVGSRGRATGADLSEPMIERARAGAGSAGLTNASFVATDAQTADFEVASYDVALSRFGVMFFADPVAAFANIRRALRPGGRLAFIAWRDMSENDWFGLPVKTFAAFVPPTAWPAPPAPGSPGPFAMADADLVRSILTRAGWTDVGVAPRDHEVPFGGRGGVEDVVDFVEHGRAGKMMLASLDDAARAAALDALRTALAPYAADDGVRMTAAMWLVTARA